MTGYQEGWFDALGSAGKCGAFNFDRPGPLYRFALCVREVRHSGMHDDTWLPWGDREATREQVEADALNSRRRLYRPPGPVTYLAMQVRELTDEQGASLFETACWNTIGIGAGEFLTAYDNGTAWDRWGHDEVTRLSMLVPFARRECSS